VSTAGQNLDRQVRALRATGCVRIFTDTQSGKTAARPELDACRDYLRPGDTLVVPSLDRLSRSLADLITLVGSCAGPGSGFARCTRPSTPPPRAGGWSFTCSPRWPSSSAS
jgi:DNA invertase Pin-like site-specific DNA recombinase